MKTVEMFGKWIRRYMKKDKNLFPKTNNYILVFLSVFIYPNKLMIKTVIVVLSNDC